MTSNPLPIWIMKREIKVLIPLRLDISIFVKDVPRVLTFISGWGRISNHLSRVPKGMYRP